MHRPLGIVICLWKVPACISDDAGVLPESTLVRPCLPCPSRPILAGRELVHRGVWLYGSSPMSLAGKWASALIFLGLSSLLADPEGPSLLSGANSLGEPPPPTMLEVLSGCFLSTFPGHSWGFIWSLWAVRVSLNSVTLVGPGKHKPATPALSSFLHQAVLQNSPLPSIICSPPLLPLQGEQDPFSASWDALGLRMGLPPNLCSAGKRRFRSPRGWGSNQRKTSHQTLWVSGANSLGDDCSSAVSPGLKLRSQGCCIWFQGNANSNHSEPHHMLVRMAEVLLRMQGTGTLTRSFWKREMTPPLWKIV